MSERRSMIYTSCARQQREKEEISPLCTFVKSMLSGDALLFLSYHCQDWVVGECKGKRTIPCCTITIATRTNERTNDEVGRRTHRVVSHDCLPVTAGGGRCAPLILRRHARRLLDGSRRGHIIARHQRRRRRRVGRDVGGGGRDVVFIGVLQYSHLRAIPWTSISNSMGRRARC